MAVDFSSDVLILIKAAPVAPDTHGLPLVLMNTHRVCICSGSFATMGIFSAIHGNPSICVFLYFDKGSMTQNYLLSCKENTYIMLLTPTKPIS